MFKQKAYKEMKHSERVFHNQNRKHQLEVDRLKKNHEKLARMSRREYMFQGAASKNLDDLEKVQESRKLPTSVEAARQSDDYAALLRQLDQEHEQGIASKKIDYPKLSSSLGKIYR